MRTHRTTLILSLFITLHAAAATRYVATNGSDTTGDGSITAPYASITKAATVAQPGDVIYVRGGVYFQQANIWTDGTATARVTYQAYPDERPIIDATGQVTSTGGPASAVTIGGDYIDFIGFEIRNAPWVGITGWGCHHVRVLNNTIHNCTRNGNPDTNHLGIIIENNSFHVMTTTAQLADVPAGAPGITYRNNNWSANPGAPAYDSAGDVIGAAGFVRAGGLNAEDYELTSTSALKDRGRTLTYITADYWLKPRAGTWDIGVHEY